MSSQNIKEMDDVIDAVYRILKHKDNQIQSLTTKNTKLEDFLDELWGMGKYENIKTAKDERDLAQNMRNKIRAFSTPMEDTNE